MSIQYNMPSPESFRAILAMNEQKRLRMNARIKAKNFSDHLTDTIHKIAHEPALAGYRIQEHVYKAVPILCTDKADASRLRHKLNDVSYHLSHSVIFMRNLNKPIKSISKSCDMIDELEATYKLSGQQ